MHTEQGIGEVLRELRERRGSTQDEVAKECGRLASDYRKTSQDISRYESGRRIPGPGTRAVLAAVFAIDPAILDRAAAISRSARRPDASSTEPPAVPQRRCHTTASWKELAADARSSAGFARFISATNVDGTAIEQLQADVASLSRRYVSHPLLDLYAEIRNLRDDTFDLLRGRQRPQHTADLYEAAGRLSGLSAHVCLDLGDYESAVTHTRTAWACADAAGHNGLRAWVRAVQSLIAFWNARPQQAAQLARAGQDFPAPGSISVRLASLEARALATAGDTRGAVTALRRADQARENMRDTDEMSGLFGFPNAKQAAYAGTTHLAIGGLPHVRQAIQHSQTAVMLYRSAEADDQSVGDVLAAHVDLATGYLHAGDVDSAEVKIRFVLEAPAEQRSASITARLRKLSKELQTRRYAGSPQVARLRQELETTTAGSPRPPSTTRSC
ncbi:helix-turn-helix domain-containing protein [Streptomyces klenkii]|uniref:helix-turn-helix domain-containing protein n=1 Tax=Streptomyces klenkii TaxID=1420899 RepID=UPI003423B675